MIDPLLKAELIRDEGFVPHAYQDHLGFWTIGYGRLIDKKRNGGITKEEAETLLENDILNVESELEKRLIFFKRLSSTHKRVLINMAFNLGVNGLLNFKKMLAALEDGFYEQAAAEALNSKWAKQVGRRATRLANLIRNG